LGQRDAGLIEIIVRFRATFQKAILKMDAQINLGPAELPVSNIEVLGEVVSRLIEISITVRVALYHLIKSSSPEIAAQLVAALHFGEVPAGAKIISLEEALKVLESEGENE
jgi:hypothetical protein